MKPTLFILCLSLIIACSSKKKETLEIEETIEEQIPVFDLQGMINQQLPDTFMWNNIAEKVTIVPLETSRRTLLSNSSYPQYIGDIIVIADFQTNTIHTFNKDGKSLNSFRHVGKGPGEYIYLTDTFYDEVESVIYVFDNGNSKIITYDQQGKFLQEKSTKNIITGNLKFLPLGVLKENVIADSTYWAKVYDKELNLINSYFPIGDVANRDRLFTQRTAARSSNKTLSLHNFIFSDTVFSITSVAAEPIAIFRKGSYALPQKEVNTFMKLPEGHKYIMGHSIDYFPGYFLFSYNYLNERRADLWNEKTQSLVSRSILTRDSQFENFKGIKYKLESGKVIGMQPSYIDGNKIVFMVSAEELVDDIPNLKEDDNPVLIVMEIKN